MRPSLWMTLALMTMAGLSASPAWAQFAAEDPVALPADDVDGAYDDTEYDQADAAADPYAGAEPADPYATDPAYGPTPPQSIGDRSVADLTTSILGTKGTQRVQDAETIVRTVIGKAASKDRAPGSSNADPVGLIQDILTATRKTKDPQN